MTCGRYQFFALILGAGAANALVRPVLKALSDEGAGAVFSGFGTSFVIWLSIGWSLQALTRCRWTSVSKGDLWAGALFCSRFLIPVASVSWIVTGVGALYWMRHPDTAAVARSALAVMAFAALRDPLASIVLKLLATPLLDADAAIVATVLGTAKDAIERTGNLIYGPTGHQLLILTGCTSYSNMSIALLGWFTISKAFGDTAGRVHWPSGVAVALAIFSINVARLAVMGTGPEAYAFMHDGFGALVSELLMIASTILIAMIGCRYGPSRKLLYRRA